MDITINNLTKVYNGRTVLGIEQLNVQSGCFLGIIGPNGAGKSTLAKIIAGLEDPSSGTVLYDHLTLDTSILKRMTMVFQRPYLLRTTVFNNIAYPLRFRKRSRTIIEMKVNRMLEEMDLVDIQRQNASTLSGGEAQKAALARAMVFEPSLLVLDEPTASIDPASIFAMEKAIQSYHQRTKATIIMITHNMQQAKRLCSDIAFMHHGRVVELGSAEAIMNASQNLLTKKFVQGDIIL